MRYLWKDDDIISIATFDYSINVRVDETSVETFTIKSPSYNLKHAKIELKKVLVLGWVMETAGHIWVDRTKRDQALRSIEKAKESLKKMELITISYPLKNLIYSLKMAILLNGKTYTAFTTAHQKRHLSIQSKMKKKCLWKLTLMVP